MIDRQTILTVILVPIVGGEFALIIKIQSDVNDFMVLVVEQYATNDYLVGVDERIAAQLATIDRKLNRIDSRGHRADDNHG